MHLLSTTKWSWIATFGWLFLISCNTAPTNEETSPTVEHPANWTEATHSNDAAPNYDIVFPQDKVNQMVITIAPNQWQAMQTNMTELFGDAGMGDNFRPPFADGELPDLPEGDFPPFPDGEFPDPANGERPAPPDGAPFGRPQGGGFGPGDMTPENPMWVEATIEFEGNIWTHVGVRYKGNSSLTSGWREGTLKLPLKLDFDEFEDDYPEIDNQRFYGFKQLSLANGFSDPSFLRDAATYDILEAAGLPAAETAFYEVVLDYGEGQQSLGLYTVIEVIDDTVIDRTFGSDDGNIYEADGPAASLSATTYEQIADSFQKENNKNDSDWSDIETLYQVLHSEQRTTDPTAWRAELEDIFAVDSFLEWLAISAVIQHWDTYGAMTHNYYLYNNPETNQLTWISWDHNMSMSSSGGPQERLNNNEELGNDPNNRFAGRPGGNHNVSLDKAEITEGWPLIRYLLDDPTYEALYLKYLAETIEGPFNPDQMATKYQEMADLIEPYVVSEVGQESFNTAIQQLIDHAYQRADEATTFLFSNE